MKALFEVKTNDKDFYKEYLMENLPPKIIDIHTHVWKEEFMHNDSSAPVRTVTWPSMVAKHNPIEDLIETYKLMFPDKEVIPMIFSFVGNDIDINRGNEYIANCSMKYGYPSLMVTKPELNPDDFEQGIKKGKFLGCKVYLNYAPHYIPESEIRIYDYLPHQHLEVLNRHGWMAILHIPRPGRLKDPVNLAQLLEIEQKYPWIKLIVAHVGRAYCPEDVGNAFEILKDTKNMMFDISANSNSYVFRQLINAVGPERILFGSDLPILRMRARRICENGKYINLVPKGLYGDVSGDSHMREVSPPESDKLTFFMYEEINAFLTAAREEGLKKSDMEDIFYNNAHNIITNIRRRHYE